MRNDNFNLFYFVSQGIKYFWSNKLISLSAVGVLAACLFIMGNFWLIYRNVQVNLAELQAVNQTVVFLSEGVSQEQIERMEQHITALPNVDQCEFISKQQAFEEYKDMYGEEYDLYSDIEQQGINPLRNSFAISMKDISLYEETVFQLQQMEGVSRIRKQSQSTIDGLRQIAKTVYFLCTWIMGLLAGASLFIIMNTIRIARFANRRQINIMKFVGATDWFVRWPFLFEGAIIGLMAAAVGQFFVWYSYTRVLERMGSAIKILTVLPYEQLAAQMMLYTLLFGLSIGVVGSLLSIRKYFDV